MGSMPHYETVFGAHGLVIPLYSNHKIMDLAYDEIKGNPQASDEKLEEILAWIYTPGHLAAMVVHRYPTVPFVADYRETISESVEAHFLGLGHVAVAGLIPVIEGAGRQIADSLGIEHKYISQTFKNLTNHAIAEINTRKLGDYEAVESILNSFVNFLTDYFYRDSRNYPLSNKTNRNGITHGSYSDAHYGEALNFYKVLGVLDTLCLISDFKVFPARPTTQSDALALYFSTLKNKKAEALATYERFLAKVN